MRAFLPARCLRTPALLAMSVAMLLSVAAPTTVQAQAPGSVPATSAIPQAAPAAAPSTVTLRFATYNVLKSVATAPAPSWSVRRSRVAATLAAASADVVGVQEATMWPVASASSQWRDVGTVAAPAGLVLVEPVDDRCAVRGAGCAHTTGLLYRAATVRLASLASALPASGTLKAGEIGPLSDADSALRKVTWAYLAPVASPDAVFLAVSLHMETAKTAAAETDRVRLAGYLTDWVRQLHAARGLVQVPTVLMADLNSYPARQPAGAQQVLTAAGWLNAATSGVDRTPRLGSINVTPVTRSYGGFPPRPWRYRPGKATRIDYVMGLGPVRMVDHRVMVRLTAAGVFDEAYRGSDHNLVRATVTLYPGT